MLLIRCPYCEQDRPEVEFSYAHQAHKPRPEAADGELDDHNWARWVYFQKNIKGVAHERWNHAAGCRKFFNAVRDTVSSEIVATYRSGEAPPVEESRVEGEEVSFDYERSGTNQPAEDGQ